MTSLENKLKHIAVLGAGIAGLSTAYELISHGQQVTLFGLSNHEGMGSHAAIGIVASRGHHMARQVDFALKLQGQIELVSWLRGLSQRSNISIVTQPGVLETFSSEEEYSKIKLRSFYHDNLSELNLEVFNAEKARKITKNQNVCGAFFYPQDYFFDPQLTMRALKLYISKSSTAKFVDNLVIKCIPDVDKKWIIQTQEGQRFGGYDEVVLACGAWSHALLQEIGVTLTRTNIFKLTIGASLFGQLREDSQQRQGYLFSKSSLILRHQSFAWGSVTCEEPIVSDSIDEAQMAEQRLRVDLELKGYSIKEAKALWGKRSLTADRKPLIGAIQVTDVHRLFINTGYYKNGYQYAVPAAKEIVDIMLKNSKTRNSLMQEFRPCRFLSASSFC